MKVSPSGRFAIDPKNESILYVAGGEAPHAWLVAVPRAAPYRHPDGTILYPFHYLDKLHINDCLQFAESMASGVKDYAKTKCVLREKGTRYKFGDAHRANVSIAKGLSPVKNEPLEPMILNEAANPEVGEAYAIVRARPCKKDEAPYHIAFVLAKDGDTNITLEANASDEDLERPVFDMYSPRDTFHDRYKDIYEPASTIVLERI